MTDFQSLCLLFPWLVELEGLISKISHGESSPTGISILLSSVAGDWVLIMN